MIKIEINGEPIAKKRPRFKRRGKAYNCQKTEEWRWLWEARKQIYTSPFTGPVAMDCVFIFARPKSHFGTGANSDKLRPSAPAHHVQRPDCDNLEKFAADCLNGVAYKDDSQIVRAIIVKEWAQPGESARSIITITEV